MSKKYVVDAVRFASGSITTRIPPLLDVTLAEGKVNVSTGVAQSASPVHKRIVLVATVDTASLNANSILRFNTKFVMLFVGSD